MPTIGGLEDLRGSDTVSNGSDDPALRQTFAAEHPMALQSPSGADLLNQLAVSTLPPSNSYSISGTTPDTSLETDSGIYNGGETTATTIPSTAAAEDARSQTSQSDTDWTSWFAGNDFDLDAVNLSLLHATFDHFPAVEGIPERNTMNIPELPDLVPYSDSAGQQENLVQRKWHTFSEQTPLGQMTPMVHQEHGHIDEAQRKKLTESLQQRIQYGILPSTSFLVRSITSGLVLRVLSDPLTSI